MKIDKQVNYIDGPTQNQTTSWLVRNYNTFGAWTSHEVTRIHKTHHDPNVGEATTFPFIVLSMLGHGTITQMSFCLGTPKWESRIPKIGTPMTLEAHNFVCRALIEVRFEAKL
jgi:hypothetical protein